MEIAEPPKTVRVESLAQAEAACRSRLAFEPTDLGARKKLAWCLFLQAIHQAGQETLLELVPEELCTEKPAPAGDVPAARAARELLRECLRQSIAIRQLSTDPQDVHEIDRLQGLVRLSGGEEALFEAEREARGILARVTQELVQRTPPRLRIRRPTRRLQA